MSTTIDMQRREAANEAIWEAGFIPVLFENSAARPFDQYEKSYDEPGIEAVKHADFFISIIDDSFSKGMQAEYKTARENLGENRIIYLFAQNSKRSLEVQNLRSLKKKDDILNEFENIEDLKAMIIKILRDDIRETYHKGPELIYDGTIKINPGKERHLVWSFEKDDNIIISILADGNVYADFITEDEYSARRDKYGEGIFDFEFESDRFNFNFQKEIKEAGKFYLVIRNSLWGTLRHVNISILNRIPLKFSYTML
jgi:hypothetical protein